MPWGFFWQRPQQLLSRIACSGEPVFYLAPTNDPRFSDRQEKGLLDDIDVLLPNLFHVWIHTGDGFDVHQHELTPGIAEELGERLLALLKQAGTHFPIYLVQHPSWYPLVELLKEKHGGMVVYDCMDEHTGFANARIEIAQCEDALFRTADLVFATSRVLYDKARKISANVELLRNGAEVERFADPAPNGKLDDYRSGPIIGYYGSIRDWFDQDLVVYLARARPSCNFIVIGDENTIDLSKLKQQPNVHVFEPVQYNLLAGYLAYFDICLIPFKITPLTLATNPVKFYEYLSAGKPVVSTRLPELEDYSGICALAETKEQFLDAVDAAIREGQSADVQRRKQREDAAHENSWDARALHFARSLGSVWEEKLLHGSLRKALQEVRLDAAFAAQVTNERVLKVRDQLLTEKDVAWDRYAKQIVHDFEKEIARIAAERDQMLADKDRIWEGELQKLSAKHREELAGLQLKQEEELRKQEQQHEEEVKRVRESYEQYLLVRGLLRARKLVRKLKDK